MTKKLNEKAFESVMMKEFEDLRLVSGIRVTDDPVQSAYHGFRAGRMVQKDEETRKKEQKLRKENHVVD